MKRSEKQLASKAIFRDLVFQISGKNCVKDLRNQFRRGLGQVRSKKLFPETIIFKMFETISNFM